MSISLKKMAHCIILLSLFYIITNMQLTLKQAEELVLLVYLYSVFSWVNTTKKMTSIYLLFLVYCLLCNAGQVLLHYFDISFEGIVHIYKDYSHTAVRKALVFQGQCISFMSIGALIMYTPKKSRHLLPIYGGKNVLNIGHYFLTWPDIIYVILYVIVVLEYVAILTVRSTSGYGALYMEGNSSGLGTVLKIAYYAFLYMCVYNCKDDRYKKAIYFSVILLSILMLAAGARGMIIPNIVGLMFVSSLNKNSIRISLKKVLLLGIAAVFLLVILQGVFTLRHYSFEQINIDVLYEAFGAGVFANVVDSIQEMGGTLRCVICTMDYINHFPDNREATMVFSVLKGIFPLELVEAFGVETPTLSLSRWITEEYGTGISGWGFSIIAEFYYNYGKNGYLAAFVFGAVWVALENTLVLALIRHRLFVTAMALVYFLAHMIFYARADLILFSSTFRYVEYIGVIELLWNTYNNRKRGVIT